MRQSAGRARRDYAALAAQLRGGFEPVHLSLLAELVTLRHEYFTATEPNSRLRRRDVAPHRWLADGVLGMLLSEPGKDAVRRVFLLPRRIAVFFQNPVDELLQRPES